MDYQRNWLEESGSDDSHGRTLWALGTLLGRAPGDPEHGRSRVQSALSAIRQTTSGRMGAA
jgi:hypothetical protein